MSMMKADVPNGFFHEAPYDQEVLAFEFEGDTIRNPYLSPCGRFDADPVKDYGFELHHSGGGCMALVKRLEDGSSIWLTDSDAGLPDPNDPDDIIIGRFNAEGEQVAYANLRDVPFYDQDPDPTPSL
ncbi:hypothetical protein [Geopseudomonas aromaticivorans]